MELRERKQFVYRRESLPNHLQLDPESKVDKKGYVPREKMIEALLRTGELYLRNKQLMYDTDSMSDKETLDPDIAPIPGRIFPLSKSDAMELHSQTKSTIEAIRAELKEEQEYLQALGDHADDLVEVKKGEGKPSPENDNKGAVGKATEEAAQEAAEGQ